MLVRRLARPLLGSFFITAGSDGIRNPSLAAPASEPVVNATLDALPGSFAQRLPRDPMIYVRINSATQLIAGLALASGKLPRLSSLVLAGTLVPATLASHPFWRESDPVLKAQQKAHFWKNTSILGGLIIAGIDTEGRPGLSWRARRATSDVAAAVASAVSSGGQASHPLAERAHEIGQSTQALAEKAGERWEEVSETLGTKAAELSETAREKAPVIADYARTQGAKLAKVAQQQGAELAEAATQGLRQVDALTARQEPKLRRFVRGLRR
ncbi:MAG: DoxX family protein [Mycobacterium sp.]